jgi:outer membrane protein TolC
VKKLSSPIRTLCVAACALVAVAGQARAQAVSDARIAELLVQAKTQVQAQQPQPAKGEPVGPTQNLTIDEAVKRSLDSNIDLGVGRLNPQLQDLAIAQILGVYRPTLTSSFGDNWNRSQPTSQLSGGTSISTGIENGTYSWAAGLSQALRWTGGTAALNWTNSRNNTTSNNSILNPTYLAGLQAQLTQPLIRNLKIDSNRQLLATGLIARENADTTLRALVINTVANTKNAYWDLVYAVQAVDAARTSLALAQKLVEDNKIRVEIGTLAPLDVVSAQAEAATRQQTLVTAAANQRTSEIALKRLIVSGTSDPIWNVTLNPVDRPPTDFNEKIDLEAALRVALEGRTDLVIARKNLESSNVSIRYLRDQILPQLDLTASYATNGTGGTYLQRSAALGGTITGTIPGGFTDALSVMRKLSYPRWSVALNLSYPIGVSSADANLARARVQYQQSLAQLKSLELSVATDLTTQALTVQSSLEQIQAAAAARELSLKRLEAMQSKFEVGMATNYDVVLAQRDFLDAQNSELRAILNYRKALVDFQRKQETSSSGSGGSSAIGTVSTTGSTGSTGGSGSSGS